MNNGTHAAAQHRMEMDADLVRLLAKNREIKKLIEMDQKLNGQFEILDAKYQRLNQRNLLNCSKDTLVAYAGEILKTKDPIQLKQRVSKAREIIDAANSALKDLMPRAEQRDPPEEGCRPPCEEPARYCCGGACYLYQC